MAATFRQHRLRQAGAQMAAGARRRDHGLIVASENGTELAITGATDARIEATRPVPRPLTGAAEWPVNGPMEPGKPRVRWRPGR